MRHDDEEQAIFRFVVMHYGIIIMEGVGRVVFRRSWSQL